MISTCTNIQPTMIPSAPSLLYLDSRISVERISIYSKLEFIWLLICPILYQPLKDGFEITKKQDELTELFRNGFTSISIGTC